jgi:hypothetical protein
MLKTKILEEPSGSFILFVYVGSDLPYPPAFLQ